MKDSERKSQWWKRARELARLLGEEHHIGGAGVISALRNKQPMNRGSQVELVLWAVPHSFNEWSSDKLCQTIYPFIWWNLFGPCLANGRRFKRPLLLPVAERQFLELTYQAPPRCR